MQSRMQSTSQANTAPWRLQLTLLCVRNLTEAHWSSVWPGYSTWPAAQVLNTHNHVHHSCAHRGSMNSQQPVSTRMRHKALSPPLEHYRSPSVSMRTNLLSLLPQLSATLLNGRSTASKWWYGRSGYSVSKLLLEILVLPRSPRLTTTGTDHSRSK